MPESMREAADPFVVFVAAAIAIQLLGHYHAEEVLRWGHFYGLWAVLRIAVPLAFLRYAGLTLSEAGIRLPSVNRKSALLAGSPALSLFGIWSGSVLPPFLIHLLVELLFITALILNFAG